jgi:hypothetical protein
MNIAYSLFGISGVLFLVLFIILWNRERIKRALLEAQEKQRIADAVTNEKENKLLQAVQKTRAERIGSSVDINDPWAGVPKESPKSKPKSVRSGAKTSSKTKNN